MQAARRRIYGFGHFRLDESERQLLKDDQPVALEPKVFETLLTLVENKGRLVLKEEIMSRVWPDSFVEEANLNRSISTLRKALGDRANDSVFIETVPKRGYRFTSKVVEVFDEEADLILEKHTSAQIITEEEEEITDSSNPELDDSSECELLTTTANPKLNLISTLRRRPVAISGTIALVALAALFYFWNTGKLGRAATAINIKSIAVLPLKSLNETSDDRALSLGFADALITSLGNLNEVRVISINAVSRYTDLQREPVEIGKNLGVDSVFDGTLQRANGKFRVTLRLIRTSDGKQIWSGSFDENESDIFHLQDSMAMQAAHALPFNLSPKQAKRPTENRDAYQAYLRGRFFFDKRTAEAYDKAVIEFERAIALDPNYALAHTGLADVYALLANGGDGKTRDELYEKSRTTATKALELDEGLAEAHTSLGWVKRVHDWDWIGSEREFKRALELNPNYVNAHQWYALLLTTLARTDEALAEIEQARELEPLSKSVLLNYFAILQYRRENEQLPALAEQIVSLDDSQPANVKVLSIAYARTGNYAKVIETGEAYQAASGGKNTVHYLAASRAVAYTQTGQEEKAKGMLDYLEHRAKTGGEAAYRLAMAYAELGRGDEAIALLQRCFATHDDRLVWVRVEPSFEFLHGDARFQEILRNMNLPPKV